MTFSSTKLYSSHNLFTFREKHEISGFQLFNQSINQIIDCLTDWSTIAKTPGKYCGMEIDKCF